MVAWRRVGAGGAGVGLADVHAVTASMGWRALNLVVVYSNLASDSSRRRLDLSLVAGPGVVVADDGQVLVRVSVDILIDGGPTQFFQSAGIEQLGHPAVDDRGDDFPR